MNGCFAPCFCTFHSIFGLVAPPEQPGGSELPPEPGQLTKVRRLLLIRDFWHGVAYSNPIADTTESHMVH